MRIVVRDIPAAGRQLRFALGDSWALEAARAAVEGEVSALEGELRLKRRKPEGVTVEAEGHLVADRPCDRCGRPARIELQASERLIYQPLAAGASHGEVELSEDELDLGWYEGEELSLDQVVSELFALAMPARILCADTATCLLPTTSSGEADDTVGHPAFAALKDLL